MNRLNEQYLLSTGITKKERGTQKVQCGGSQWIVQYIVYEKDMKIQYEFVDAKINYFT